MARLAIFRDLISDEDGNTLETTYIGGDAHYIIDDAGFKRHVDALTIDRQVVERIQAQALDNKELVAENIMTMMGKDDLFTKAMIDSSLGKMDQMLEQDIPHDARMMLGMMGFRIIVNVYGDVIEFEAPGQSFDED